MNFERLGRRGLLLAACATSVFAAPAFAQQQATTAQDDQPVEEIIVTATRRETALQNVAVAVTAIGAQAIESAGVKDIRDLTQLAPSLHSAPATALPLVTWAKSAPSKFFVAHKVPCLAATPRLV